MAVASPEKIDRSRPSRVANPEADAASETSSVHSSEQSDRRDVDILTQVLSSRSEEYRLLFRLPPDEVLVQDFNCALQENILIQGHLYLFIRHICFYSNIFGFESKKTILFNEVTCVRKAKTAAIFPNAIEIVAGGKKHFFGSFLSRDEAYRLIIDAWAQHNNDIKVLLERQDSKSGASSQDSIVVIPEKIRASKVGDDPSSADSIKEPNLLEQPETLPNGKLDINVAIKPLDAQANGAEENTDNFSPENLLSWIVEDVDAPKVPEHFTMVAESRFPVLLVDFFTFFVSDHAIGFLEDFHRRCGDKSFQCSPWRQHEQFFSMRDVSFLHPVKIFLGSKFGQCHEVQKCHLYKNSHMVVETSQQISDVPFSDYFQVEGIWYVEQDNGENSCTLRVYSNVAFSKKTMFGGKIEQSTKDECREVYANWISMAHELLKQKTSGQSKGIADQNSCLAQEDGSENFPQLEESTEKSHPALILRKIPQGLHDLRNYSPEVAKPGQGEFGYFLTMISVFTQIWLAFVSYVKRQRPSALVLAMVLFAILILMQISIIVLLTRVPKVHLISYGSSLNDISGYNLENIEWLENRFNYLKEEMLTVETRLERMRHEYTLLKAHLQRLAQLKSKL